MVNSSFIRLVVLVSIILITSEFIYRHLSLSVRERAW